MRPKTSVRQPIIAGASKQRLSEMLRRWRRQPRKRSLLLFWIFLSLALISDSLLLVLGARLVGGWQLPTAAPAERHIYVPYAVDAALWEPLRHWVIRADGRTQLFESFCRKAVREITGDEHFEGYDPLVVAVSWWLDSGADALKWNDYPCLRCEDAELRAVLYREKRNPSCLSRREQLHGRYVEPSVVSSSASFHDILRNVRIAAGNLRLSSLERKAVALQNRLQRFQQIRRGCFVGGNRAETETARAALVQEYQSENPDYFAAALTDFIAASRQTRGADEDPRDSRRFACEAWLNKYRPAQMAAYLSLLAAGLFAAAAIVRIRRPRWRRGLLLAGCCACLGCLGWAAVAIVCGAIREGALVSAGGQGLLWSAFVVLGLSLFLALRGRDAFLAFTGTLASSGGLLLANRWPPVFAEYWPSVPEGMTTDPWLRLQVLLLVSAYATLALAWALAALTLARMLLAALSGERVRELAAICLRLLRIGVALLTASALLDACRALGQGAAWRGWNAQALGTLLVLPGCAALVYVRRRGWIQPFALLFSIVFGLTLTAMMWQTVHSGEIASLHLGDALAVEGWLFAAGFVSISVAAHAALRYYFGRQRILDV